MVKIKLYDEEGNEIRVKQKQKKPFYKKWWVWLIVFVIAITDLGREKEIADKPEETETVEEVVEKHTYTYEDFKGSYATFEGVPYETPIDYLVYLDDHYYFSGYPESESYIHNISDKIIDMNGTIFL